MENNIKEEKLFTEIDYEKASKNALALSIGGWILSAGLIGVIMECYVFKYANRAMMSKNPKIVSKALLAKKIASVFWLAVIVGGLVLLLAGN